MPDYVGCEDSPDHLHEVIVDLMKDKARLDWIEANCDHLVWASSDVENGNDQWIDHYGGTIRKGIDAAMKEKDAKEQPDNRLRARPCRCTPTNRSAD